LMRNSCWEKKPASIPWTQTPPKSATWYEQHRVPHRRPQLLRSRWKHTPYPVDF
jgi:hypothetical protein